MRGILYLPPGIQYHSRQLSREAYRHYNLPLTSMFHSENNILLHFLQCQKQKSFQTSLTGLLSRFERKLFSICLVRNAFSMVFFMLRLDLTLSVAELYEIKIAHNALLCKKGSAMFCLH